MIKIKPHLENLYRVKPSLILRKGCLRLDMNEGIPGLPDNFIKSILSKIDLDLLSTYPEYEKLTEKLAGHNGLKPGNICLANGSDSAIKYIFDAYVSSGNKVLFAEPSFAMYAVYCRMFNAFPVTVKYKKDLSFPSDDFIKKIGPGIKLAVVVNPNNPTGTAISQEALLAIIKKAAKHNVLLIIDEAYYYFYPKTVIRLVKRYKNLIVLRTFSKLCGMAGLRLGYAASCPEIIEGLRKVKPTFDINNIAITFAERLLSNPQIIQGLIKDALQGKEYLLRQLEGRGIEYREGQANFVLIFCKNRVKEISLKLAREKVLIASGFKQDFLKNYIRVTIGNKAAMEKFWKVFLKIWKAK